MCLFHRASMLVANDRLDEALTELETLKGLTPKESLVYFLIGKVNICMYRVKTLTAPQLRISLTYALGHSHVPWSNVGPHSMDV